MTLRAGLIVLLLAAALVDAVISVAVIYHLRRYTLPSWTTGRSVAGVYVVLTLLLFIMAILFVLEVPRSAPLPETFRFPLTRIPLP